MCFLLYFSRYNTLSIKSQTEIWNTKRNTWILLIFWIYSMYIFPFEKSENFVSTNYLKWCINLFSSACHGDEETVPVPVKRLQEIKRNLCKAFPNFHGNSTKVEAIQYDIAVMSERIQNYEKKLKGLEDKNRRYLEAYSSNKCDLS